MKRFIKIGKRTATHRAVLESKGYEVEERDGSLVVEASEVIEGTINLSTPEKAKEILGEVINKKAVFSYTTKFQFPDGKELYGVMACTRLGKASALVTKGKPKAKTGGAFSDIMDAL